MASMWQDLNRVRIVREYFTPMCRFFVLYLVKTQENWGQVRTEKGFLTFDLLESQQRVPGYSYMAVKL